MIVYINLKARLICSLVNRLVVEFDALIWTTLMIYKHWFTGI